MILKHIKIDNIDDLQKKSIHEFNKYFGSSPHPSLEFIQSPGSWSMVKYNNSIRDNTDFFNATKFKWSFNIKPDLVIHLSNVKAICIEAKFESSEGMYPSNHMEKNIFKTRGLPYVKQTSLQQYMMEKLLGISTEFIFLLQNDNAQSNTHKTITWKEVFTKLNISDSPMFIQKWIERLRSPHL